MPVEPVLYRQGDVLLQAVDAIPAVARTVVKRDGGRIILAYGEVTGHAHAIVAPESEATLLSAGENARFLRLMADVDLVHEEHAPVHLPAGNYQVIRQREWTDADGDQESWRYAGD